MNVLIKLCPYLYTEGRVDDTKYIKKKVFERSWNSS